MGIKILEKDRPFLIIAINLLRIIIKMKKLNGIGIVTTASGGPPLANTALSERSSYHNVSNSASANSSTLS